MNRPGITSPGSCADAVCAARAKVATTTATAVSHDVRTGILPPSGTVGRLYARACIEGEKCSPPPYTTCPSSDLDDEGQLEAAGRLREAADHDAGADLDGLGDRLDLLALGVVDRDANQRRARFPAH